MAIRVIFGKDGFYHPAFGRMGRGRNAGRIYILPDQFAEQEEFEYEVRDPRTREVKEKRKKTRYKHLPDNVKILDDAAIEELKEQALEDGEDPPKPIKPKEIDPDKLQEIKGTKRPSRSKAKPTGDESAAPKKAGGRRAAQ